MSDANHQPSAEWQDCDLETGFQRGDTSVKKVRVRKPKAGELRGLNLQDLFHADVAAIITVLPRITDPVISTQDAENLDPVDLMELGGAIKGFFFNAATKAMIAQMNSQL